MRIEKLLEAIRMELIRQKISQRELERRYGWGHGYLSQILAGRVDLKVKTLLQVVQAFEIEPHEFLRRVAVQEAVEEAVEAEVGTRQTHEAGRLVRPEQMDRLVELLLEVGEAAREIHGRKDKEAEEAEAEMPKAEAQGSG